MSSHLQAGKYYGAVRRQRSWPGVVATELLHTRARKLPQHSHRAPFFCLLLEGDYREKVGFRTIEYTPFTLGYHPPELVHSDEVGIHGGRFFCLEVSGHGPANLKDFDAELESAPSLCGEHAVWLAARLYRLHREDVRQDPLILESLLAELLAELGSRRWPNECSAPVWLAQVKELLRANLSHQWTLNALAAAVGVHPVHLSRVFRKRERQTAGDFLNRLRVKTAGKELMRGRVPLAELALTLGFADQSHFTRVFKRIAGETPAAFRARLRGF